MKIDNLLSSNKESISIRCFDQTKVV